MAARPGLAIGPGGRYVDDIGVIGRRTGDLAAHDRPAERTLAADEAVDDRRVGLQPHLLVQAVDEDAGDTRALVGATILLLDDRGEDDQFLGRLDRQTGGNADIPENRDLAARHHVEDAFRGAARKAIGVGQDRAFLGHFRDIAGQKLVVPQPLGDLLARQPLGDGDRILDRLAAGNDTEDLLRADARLEQARPPSACASRR